MQLIDAFAATLEKTAVDAQLWIVGAGPQESELRHRIDALRLSDRIKLQGFRSDVKGLFETLDAFVLSSLREGLPNVVLEAMAMSVPVVCTRVAGVPSLVTDTEHGLVCDPGNVRELSERLNLLLTDQVLRKRLSQAGRARVVSDYSFAQRMEKIRRVYDKVLGLSLDQQVG